MKKNNQVIPAALTVAGSDSGGGAGIQADLRTFSAHGVFGTSAITAVTSQNPLGVTRVDAVPPEGVVSQMKAVFDAFSVKAMKTGMLFSCEIIEAVSDYLKDVKIPVVVDPVMVATSGVKLLRDDALAVLQQKFLPLASWLTPNIPEAEFLTGKKIENEADAWKSAEWISKNWNTNVILKGGHFEQDAKAVDYVYTKQNEKIRLSADRVRIQPYSSHGTGCTLSSAMTAQIALGAGTEEVLKKSKEFVLNSLISSRFAGTPENRIHVMFPPPKISVNVEVVLL